MPASSACSRAGIVASSCRSRSRSACSVSACELTDTYSPAAIDSAPATSPAKAATRMGSRAGCAAATPTTRLLVEIRPSLAPSTAARSQPMLSVRWDSRCRRTERGDTSRPGARAVGAEHDGLPVGGRQRRGLPRVLAGAQLVGQHDPLVGDELLEGGQPEVVVALAVVALAALARGGDLVGQPACPFLPGEVAALVEHHGHG